MSAAPRPRLKVTSQNPNLGEAKEEVPVEYDGEALNFLAVSDRREPGGRTA